MKRTKNFKLFVYFLTLTMILASALAVPAQKKKDLEKARKITAQGNQLFNNKDYRNAIGKYTEAIGIVPTYAPAHFWKGYAHYYLDEYEQAAADLDSALTNGFTPIEVYKVRYYVYYLQKNYDAALSDAEQGRQLDQNFANTVLYNVVVGDIYRFRESYTEAINYYNKAVQMQPSNNGDVYYFIAFCYFKTGNYTQQGLSALESLKSGTKYLGEANYLVGDALFKSRKPDEAVQFYEQAIVSKPDFYEAYGTLSDIYRSQNKFEEAIAVTRKGLREFPADSGFYTSLAWYYSLADRHQDAILAAQSAIKLAPNQYMAYTNLCRAYNDTKQYQMAINSCNSALRLKPGDGETFLYMARAYEFLKQSDKAVEYYKKAVEGLQKFTGDNPDYSDGFYLLGNAYFALQRDNEAIEAYKRCLQLAPRFARARFTLGYTYNEKGNKALAREQYNILVGIDQNLAEKLRQVIEK